MHVQSRVGVEKTLTLLLHIAWGRLCCSKCAVVDACCCVHMCTILITSRASSTVLQIPSEGDWPPTAWLPPPGFTWVLWQTSSQSPTVTALRERGWGEGRGGEGNKREIRNEQDRPKNVCIVAELIVVDCWCKIVILLNCGLYKSQVISFTWQLLGTRGMYNSVLALVCVYVLVCMCVCVPVWKCASAQQCTFLWR